jgi:hypothetical protein
MSFHLEIPIMKLLLNLLLVAITAQRMLTLWASKHDRRSKTTKLLK